jgi:hypothetical protein
MVQQLRGGRGVGFRVGQVADRVANGSPWPRARLRSFARVRRLRRAPFDVQVLAEPDEELALAALRNAVIRGVDNPRRDAIGEAGAASTGSVLAEPREMVGPRLALPPLDLGAFQLAPQVGEIIAEARARQSLDVFENESLRRRLSNGADRLGEHIARV